jgi:hypothetical protein
MGLVRSPVWELDSWERETVLSLDGKRRQMELRKSTDISLVRAVVEMGEGMVGSEVMSYSRRMCVKVRRGLLDEKSGSLTTREQVVSVFSFNEVEVIGS